MVDDIVKKGTIKMYGADWCADTRLAKRFLEKHGIAYEWIDIERSDDARELVRQINHGFASVPTIVFDDGTTLTEPSWSDLAEKFLTLDT
jgi:glutaredoxin-like protein